MIAKLLQSGVNIFRDEKKNLCIQMVAFVILPILYLVFLNINAVVLGQSIGDILQKSATECLNMILMFASLYSGYIVWAYFKNQASRFTMMSYGIVFVTQVVQKNVITLAIMIFYLYQFVGFHGIKQRWQEAKWEKGILTIPAALLVLLVSAGVIFVRTRL
ncbi:MAG: hypothetical protein PHW34_06690 [Hespellia sp.]|nr:hypothetical protein [Hespellia sp.]